MADFFKWLWDLVWKCYFLNLMKWVNYDGRVLESLENSCGRLVVLLISLFWNISDGFEVYAKRDTIFVRLDKGPLSVAEVKVWKWSACSCFVNIQWTRLWTESHNFSWSTISTKAFLSRLQMYLVDLEKKLNLKYTDPVNGSIFG